MLQTATAAAGRLGDFAYNLAVRPVVNAGKAAYNNPITTAVVLTGTAALAGTAYYNREALSEYAETATNFASEKLAAVTEAAYNKLQELAIDYGFEKTFIDLGLLTARPMQGPVFEDHSWGTWLSSFLPK